MPDVSVLMPVLNAGAYLRPAIESVLAQQGPTLELVVIDDGSTDGSRQVIESVDDSRVRMIRNEQTRGLPATLNIGLARASGVFVARLDQDDIARRGRLERQVDYLRRHPQIVLVGSQARLIDESGVPIGIVQRCCDETTIRWYNIVDNPFIHSSVMFRRREVVEEFGGYDDSLRLCEDWELWGRIIARHRVCNLDDALIDYRTLPASMMGAIESSPAHPQRALLRNIAKQLIARHTAQTLGAGAVSDDDADLLTGFLLGVDGAALGRFLSVFERLLAAFEAAHSNAQHSADFARAVARQFDAIAFRVTPARRRSALRVYAAAVRHGVAITRSLPWTRALVLMALGRSGRDRMRHLRNASRIASPV